MRVPARPSQSSDNAVGSRAALLRRKPDAADPHHAARIGDLGVRHHEGARRQGERTADLATTRLKVKFDPNMPIEQFVPVRAVAAVLDRLPQKLADVPEISLEDPCPQSMSRTSLEHAVAT